MITEIYSINAIGENANETSAKQSANYLKR
jgi:hypothetical protein